MRQLDAEVPPPPPPPPASVEGSAGPFRGRTPGRISPSGLWTPFPGITSRDPIDFRPNDGSGVWPDFSNTGYNRAPTYPGSLTDYTGGMTQSGWVPIQESDGTTISFKRFLGKMGVGYLGVGDNLTFVGCLFEGTQPNDNLVQIYSATTCTFRYCTFKPNQYSTPPGNNGTISSSTTAPGTPYNQSWQLIANMVAGTVTRFEYCDMWGGAGCQTTGGDDAANPGTFYRCYLHDCADNDGSGGSGYHHDAIGPDSEGGSHDTLVDGCTIASLGNTNGVALQGNSAYNRITVKNCYISGWGYAVSIGVTQPWSATNITVTDNVFSTELETIFGPLYGNLWNDGGGTNTWRRNRYQVRAGDQDAGWTTGDHGRYWWPTDNNSHAGDYTG